MHTLASSGLRQLDWVVIGAYFAVLMTSAVLLAFRRQRTTEDYFLGGHSMPVWAVALSILATAQSAATFVGVPEAAYRSDMSYLSANLGGMLAAILLATVFIPAYYRRKVTTPYQLLETRFGPSARLATTWTYMIGRVFAGGARLFIGAVPAAYAFTGSSNPDSVLVALVLFTVFGILYTLYGGVSSAIWTDVLQVGVYLGAAFAVIAFLLHTIPVPFSEIIDALAHPAPGAPSKLTILKIGIDPSERFFGFDPSAEFTLLTALFGFSLITIASHGADQDLVQRMLTCKSAAKGSWSVISGILVGVPAVLVFLTIGLLLWVFYNRPDLMGSAAPTQLPEQSKDLIQTFAMHSLPAGLTGLVIVGLMAAGPAGINASLNSMSSTFVSDVYRPMRPGRSERHYLIASRLGVVGAGVIVGSFAVLCIELQRISKLPLLSFALAIMTFAYAGLLGVFFTALFTRRGNPASVIASIITGFVVVFLLNAPVWNWVTGFVTTRDAAGKAVRLIAEQRLAYPWHLFIGAVIAFLVCVAGRPRPATAPAAP